MLYTVTGSLLDAPQKIIAHGCNCRGAYAAGVAKQIRNRWPQAYQVYLGDIQSGNAHLGSFSSASVDNGTRVIVNCYTQDLPGPHASANAIRLSLTKLISDPWIHGSGGFAVPLIGCGIGGLNWEEDVYPIIKRLSRDVDIWVYSLGGKH